MLSSLNLAFFQMRVQEVLGIDGDWLARGGGGINVLFVEDLNQLQSINGNPVLQRVETTAIVYKPEYWPLSSFLNKL